MKLTLFLRMGLALGLASLIGACSLPVGLSNGVVAPSSSTLTAETKVVLRFSPSTLVQKSKATFDFGINNIGYVAVQMLSKNTGQMKFATTSVSNGVATVALSGLGAGVWALRVSCYDWNGVNVGSAWSDSPDSSKALLLYTGESSCTVQPGSSVNAAVVLYKTGELNTVDSVEAVVATSVLISADDTSYQGALSAGLSMEMSALGKKGADYATDQRFLWSSSNPTVASITTSSWGSPSDDGASPYATVHALNEGTTTITAKAAMGGVSATFTIHVTLAGYWIANGSPSTYLVLTPASPGYDFRTNLGAAQQNNQFRGTISPRNVGTTHWPLKDWTWFNFQTQALGGAPYPYSGFYIDAQTPNTITAAFPSSSPLPMTRVVSPVLVTAVGALVPGPDPVDKTGVYWFDHPGVSPVNATVPFTTLVADATHTCVEVINHGTKSAVVFKTPGTYTIKARAVDNPSVFTPANYNISSLAPAQPALGGSHTSAPGLIDFKWQFPLYAGPNDPDGNDEQYYPCRLLISTSTDGGTTWSAYTDLGTANPDSSQMGTYTYTGGTGGWKVNFRVVSGGTDNLGIQWAENTYDYGPIMVPYPAFPTPTALNGSAPDSTHHAFDISVSSEVPINTGSQIRIERSLDGTNWTHLTTVYGPSVPGGTVTYNYLHGLTTGAICWYRAQVLEGLDISANNRSNSAYSTVISITVP